MNNLLWIDAITNPDKLIDYNIQEQEDVETIAGISCNLLTVNSEEGVTKFYYSNQFYINPDNFKNHEYGFWKFCIEKTKSFLLKSVSDTKDMYLEIIAKEVKEMNIENAEFKLPNLPRVESPEK